MRGGGRGPGVPGELSVLDKNKFMYLGAGNNLFYS